MPTLRKGVIKQFADLPVRVGALLIGDEDEAYTATVGAVAAPTSGTVTVDIRKVGNIVRLDFRLTAARIVVTDAGGTGSFGALKLFD